MQGSKLEAASYVPMALKGRKARRQIYDYIKSQNKIWSSKQNLWLQNTTNDR